MYLRYVVVVNPSAGPYLLNFYENGVDARRAAKAYLEDNPGHSAHTYTWREGLDSKVRVDISETWVEPSCPDPEPLPVDILPIPITEETTDEEAPSPSSPDSNLYPSNS